MKNIQNNKGTTMSRGWMTYAEEQEARAIISRHRCKGWLDDDWQEHNQAASARVQLAWWWRVCASFGVFI